VATLAVAAVLISRMAVGSVLASDTSFAADTSATFGYSTYLGPRSDHAFYTNYVGIGVDQEGRAYVSTSVAEKGFPTTPDACQKIRSETAITRLSADGGELMYSSFFGPPDTWTTAYDMAVDERGNAYVVGITESMDFPATASSYHAQWPVPLTIMGMKA
jgi:hypothetical protein